MSNTGNTSTQTAPQKRTETAYQGRAKKEPARRYKFEVILHGSTKNPTIGPIVVDAVDEVDAIAIVHLKHKTTDKTHLFNPEVNRV